MPVITGKMASLSCHIEEDYGQVLQPGMVFICGVLHTDCMSKEQLNQSVDTWLSICTDEDPKFFRDSLYVALKYMNGTIKYMPVEIFKKYATEYW